VWAYRWRELDREGKRSLRKQIIGTVQEFRSGELHNRRSKRCAFEPTLQTEGNANGHQAMLN
jgi:hypothetical protein